MVLVWLMDKDSSDRRLPHKPEPTVYRDIKSLEKIGVLYWKVDMSDYEKDLKEVREDRGYIFSDVLIVQKDKLANYEEMTSRFFEEHIHTDEEVRFILEGSGYFDVRDENDQWLRIFIEAGDFLVLPAGIYHRYTNDTNDYIKAQRLFQKHPVWTPYNRCENGDNMGARIKYLDRYDVIDNQKEV